MKTFLSKSSKIGLLGAFLAISNLATPILALNAPGGPAIYIDGKEQSIPQPTSWEIAKNKAKTAAASLYHTSAIYANICAQKGYNGYIWAKNSSYQLYCWLTGKLAQEKAQAGFAVAGSNFIPNDNK